MKKQFFDFRLLSLLPTLGLLVVIFMFSAQTGEESGGLSYAVSIWLVSLFDRVFQLHIDSTTIAIYADAIHTFVRKAAHMTEYALLALSATLPWFVYHVQHRRSRLPVTLVFCAASAALDEFHQSFVAGRGPSVADVGIDSLGALLALVFLQLILWLIRQRAAKQRQALLLDKHRIAE